MSTTKPKRLISTAQAAQRLGVSPNTIRNYVAKGLLKAERIGPKLLKFELGEIERFAHHIDNGTL